MKKHLLSIALALALCLSLLPMTALAISDESTAEPDMLSAAEAVSTDTLDDGSSENRSESQPAVQLLEGDSGDNTISLTYTDSCDSAHTQTVYLKDHLPNDTVVTYYTIALPNFCNGSSFNYTPGKTANVEGAYFSYKTSKQDEPVSGTATVTVMTSNHGNYTFRISITLTGKYLVTLSAQSQNAYADGQPHPGYSALTGKLTNGTAYDGDYSFAYAKKDGTVLSEAPSEPGDYIVTITIPESNENYKHKDELALNFSLLSQPQAQYQAEKDSEWLNGSIDEALANVYTGGTVKLLQDVTLTKTAVAAKSMTITSADAENPCTITSDTDAHGYLLNITGDVTLENVIVDGGSAADLTATRAAIAVNGGKLTIGSGAVIRNNKNKTNSGFGGGVCVISGEATLTGGAITGCTGYFGGGVGMVGGTFYAKSGTIANNTSSMGGGIAVWMLGSGTNNTVGTLHISGSVSVTDNSAQLFGGGIVCYYSSKTYLSGSPTIRGNTSPEETNGGFYLDGNPTNGFAVVTLSGVLGESADVCFYSWKGADSFVLAEPADGYTITPDDMSHLSYDKATLATKLENGKVVLTDEDVYAITFDANDGSSRTTTAKTADGKLICLPSLEREGYDLDGWFTASEGGEAVTTETSFVAATTLYAHWTKKAVPTPEPTPTPTEEPAATGTPAPTAAPTATPAPKAPNTGDEANVVLWLVLATVSVFGVAVVGRKKVR